MKLLVGFTADERGAEAIELASAVVRGTREAALEIAIVLPVSTPFNASYPGGDHGFNSILSAQVDRWAAEALAQVPDGIIARVVARSVPSVAEGLMELADELGANGIVLGGRSRHRAGFFMPGGIANALLHAASVQVIMSSPQAIASLREANGRITRLTAFVGDRPGARDVISSAARMAAGCRVELRLATLVSQADVEGSESAFGEHVQRVETFLAELTESLGFKAHIEVIHGQTLDEAIEQLTWVPGDLAVLGSARLAAPRRLFIGPKAQRILRHLDVPMAVIPTA